MKTIAVRSAALMLGSLFAAYAALAADLTVTAFGGTWEKAYRKCFVEPFEKKTGKSVDVTLGNPLQWVNQVAASPDKPPIDVMVSTPEATHIAVSRNVLDPISAKDVPNMAQLDPRLVEYGKGYGFPITYGDFGLMYNAKRVKNPPKTWKEFVDGVVAGKWQASIPDINYVATPAGLITLFNQLYGGSPTNIQPALDQVKRMRDSKNVTFFSDPNAPLNAMRNGDIDIAMYYDGRAWAEHDSGNPDIAWVNPGPGSVAFPNMAVKVKNGSPLGTQFLNELASAEGQSCFANTMQYTASNTKVTYELKVKPRIATVDGSIWVNFEDIGKYVPQWIEAWNKQIGR
ncbi:ABC transporter, periplasmic spermidine putrescine-binding protein PotD [Candidatus Burkholderia verschuerenii]|uniref:ABC transporter, periplasmic spermidine putrescine-binding protein PotD n=1 Tax=Candidatus Burkholderia verschuerenii TaxID=242163 RepID=A0A0L0MIN7_9BURK|nr:extracellular solute-binding protein [Candidatus Burkholderia verschuerenii]KND62146.1 ABC transporter, periplasmic spermidine putrescine-binding protein PotD [Candidatus Burkholderia verschuerenii]